MNEDGQVMVLSLPLFLLLIFTNLGVLARTDLTVAVLPFEVAGNVQLRWGEKDVILDGITQMVTDQLAK